MKTISALDKLFPAPKDGNPGNDAVMYRIVCSDTTPNVTMVLLSSRLQP